MTGEIDERRGDAHYAEFYRNGGWKYSFRKELRWHRTHLLKRFNLRRSMRMLEVACGSGFHTNLFNRMGFDCIGVDRSKEGIDSAKKHYAKRTFHCCDFREMPVDPESFDVVIARGFSYYHYDLLGNEAMGATKTLMRYVKPGGVFVMIIVTDLSGRREPGCIWHNTLEEYRSHFSAFGKKWSVDWADGMVICGLFNSPTDTAKLQCDQQRVDSSVLAFSRDDPEQRVHTRTVA